MRLPILEHGKIGALSFMVAKKTTCTTSFRRLFGFIAISLIPVTSFAAELYYYDGIVKRPLVVDNQKWANLKSGKSVELQAISTNEKSGKFFAGSPVFRSGETGASMALPGGIIVKPKSGDTTAEAKLKAKGYEIERAIGDSGALLVKSPEGMSSLELANKLHESGDFESASPNWWRERRKK
jgi:hypothetical protein